MSIELLGAIAISSATAVPYLWRYYQRWPKAAWTVLLVSAISWSWILAAFLMPPTVAKTSFHRVVPCRQHDGTVIDTIVVDGRVVNVNAVLGRHVPTGAQIKRTEYKDSVLGLVFRRSPSYAY